jgi:pteridine reductase
MACAREGANIAIHHGHSPAEAESLAHEVRQLGRDSKVLHADLADMRAVDALGNELAAIRPLHALVNNAAIFEDITAETTSLPAWDRHIRVNLTTPFLLSQAYSRQILEPEGGQIVNILDWRALKPGADHFPYSITKAALAAMTHALAISFAPRIRVNGLALGAMLPPGDGGQDEQHISRVPLRRWAAAGEAEAALVYLLTSSGYVTGEILHVDGGRHLV